VKVEDAGSLWDDLQPEGGLALFHLVRVDKVLELLVSTDRAEVAVHVRVLDCEVVLELECGLQLERVRKE